MISKKSNRICMCCGERKETTGITKYCEDCSRPNTLLLSISDSTGVKDKKQQPCHSESRPVLNW